METIFLIILVLTMIIALGSGFPVAFSLPGLPGTGFRSPQAFNVTDDNLPAAGSAPIVFMADSNRWRSITYQVMSKSPSDQ